MYWKLIEWHVASVVSAIARERYRRKNPHHQEEKGKTLFPDEHLNEERNWVRANLKARAPSQLESLVLQFLERRDLHDISDTEHVQKKLREVRSRIESPEFRACVEHLRTSVGHGEDRIYETAYEILGNPAHLRALGEPQFHDFHRFVTDTYGIPPDDEDRGMERMLSAYLNIETQRGLRSPNVQKAFALLKAIFPQWTFDTWDDLLILQYYAGEKTGEQGLARVFMPDLADFEKRLRTSADVIRKVEMGTGITVKKDDLTVFMLRSEEHLKNLVSSEANELYQYFKLRYPAQVHFTSFQQFLRTFEDINSFFLYRTKTTPEVFDRFLSIFGTNLGKFNFSHVGREAFLGEPLDFVALAKDPAFRTFVEDHHTERHFPRAFALQSPQTIERLARAYAKREEFQSYNEKMKGFRESSDYDFVPENRDLKIAILDQLQGMNIETNALRIRDDDYGDPQWFTQLITVWEMFGGRGRNEAQDLTAALAGLKQPQAKQLFERWTTDWKISHVDLNLYLGLCTDEKRYAEARDFFLDPANAQKYSDVVRTFNIGIPADRSTRDTRHPVGEHDLTHTEILSHAQMIVKLHSYIAQPENMEFLRRIYAPEFRPGTPDAQAADLPIDRAFTMAAEMADHDIAAVKEVVQILEEELGFDRSDVRVILSQRYADGIIDAAYLETLRDPTFRTFYEWLRTFLEKSSESGRKPSPGMILSHAKQLQAYPLARTVLEQAATLGYSDVFPGRSTESILNLLRQDSLTKHMEEKDFHAFHERTLRMFPTREVSVTSLTLILQLYESLQGRDEDMKLFFSPKLQEVLTFLREETHATRMNANLLLPILSIARSFDRVRMKALVEKLRTRGDTVEAFDVALLATIVKNPTLEARLFDEAALLQGVRDLYAQKKPHVPKRIDYVEYLESLKQRETSVTKKEELDAQIALVKASHERPAPTRENFPLLQLLRTNVLAENLRTKQFLDTLGHVISDDLGNSEAEAAGSMVFSDNGSSLTLQSWHAYTSSPRPWDADRKPNHMFTSPALGILTDGIAFYHCHATHEDCSDTATPSGWFERTTGRTMGGKGDIDLIYQNHSTGILFSTRGHPTQEEIPPFYSHLKPEEMLRINVRHFFMDYRDFDNVALRDVDMGDYVVPYRKAAMKP